MSAKDARQLKDEFMAMGLRVTRTGGGHYRVTDANGKFLIAMGATPSDRNAVVIARTQLKRAIRKREGEEAAEQEIPADSPAGDSDEPAPVPGMTKEQRRFIQAQIDEREARIAEQIRVKGQRKVRTVVPAKPLAERVRPRHPEGHKFGYRFTTGPDGRRKVFSESLLEDGTIVRGDIRDADTELDSEFKCAHCFGPPAVELGYYQIGWRGFRDLYLALGDRLKAAEARARLDFEQTREYQFASDDGEVVVYGLMKLCRRCYDRSGLERSMPPDEFKELGPDAADESEDRRSAAG